MVGEEVLHDKKMASSGTENLLSSSAPPMRMSRGRRRMKASIYILPNLFTASSLLCGFLAMKFATDARLAPTSVEAMKLFTLAAYLILVGAACDALDGSVARLTRTTSSFGVQFDSLSDLVSFGVAPAFLSYQFALHNLGRIGVGVAFIFAACGALRLARFNVQSSVGKASGNFTGIPIPMAAAPVAVYILAQDTFQNWLADTSSPRWQNAVAALLTQSAINAWVLLAVLAVLALGMISTFEYVSTKTLRLPRKHPFRVLAAVIMVLAVLFSLDFAVAMAILLIIYCVHGPFLWFFLKRHRGDEEEELFAVSVEGDDEESSNGGS